jgi:hypothetical protein
VNSSAIRRRRQEKSQARKGREAVRAQSRFAARGRQAKARLVDMVWRVNS